MQASERHFDDSCSCCLIAMIIAPKVYTAIFKNFVATNAFMRFPATMQFSACALFTCLSCGWIVNDNERRFIDGFDAFIHIVL